MSVTNTWVELWIPCFLYFVNFGEQTGKTVLPEEKPLLAVLMRINKLNHK